jgi:predicted RND superfamily exporter protein
LLGGLLLVSLLLGFGLGQLRVERDTRSMISSSTQQQAVQERARTLFGNDSTLLLSLTPPQLLSADGLSLLAEVTVAIAALDGVEQVLSLTSAEYLLGSPQAGELPSLLPHSADDILPGLERSLRGELFYRGLLLSSDGRTAGLIIFPADDMVASGGLPQLIRATRRTMADFDERAELHLSGVAVQQSDVADYIRRDQRVVMPLVFVLLTLMLSLSFRRLSGVLLPLATTVLSLIWTLGLYALCGYELNTISALLPPLVMILAVSNSVHLYNGWLHLAKRGPSPTALWAGKVAELAIPCSFTALTTSFGLLSLTLSSIPAVRQFGVFGALGVLFSLLISLLLVPLVLASLSPPTARFQRGNGRLQPVLQRLSELSIRRAPVVLLLAVVLTIAALLAVPRLQNDTNLVAFLDEDAPLAVATDFIDKQLGGVNILDFLISRSDGKPFNRRVDFQVLERFERLLEQHQEVAQVISIVPLLRRMPSLAGGSGKVLLPNDEADLRAQFDALEMAAIRPQTRQLLSADHKTVRMRVFLPELGSQRALATVRDLERQGKAIFADNYQLEPSGSFYSMMLDSEHLVSDMLSSFSLSLSLVMLALLILLRSFKLTLVALIPNLIPIVWTLGLMAAAGIALSTGTAMIGAVAFGLAVDDTIHYLLHFRRVRNQGVANAVRITTTTTGRALMITTLVLTLGFWSGCLGSFNPTVYFSLLVGCTLLGALVCDLLVLPAALVLWPSASGTKTMVTDNP